RGCADRQGNPAAFVESKPFAHHSTHFLLGFGFGCIHHCLVALRSPAIAGPVEFRLWRKGLGWVYMLCAWLGDDPDRTRNGLIAHSLAPSPSQMPGVTDTQDRLKLAGSGRTARRSKSAFRSEILDYSRESCKRLSGARSA